MLIQNLRSYHEDFEVNIQARRIKGEMNREIQHFHIEKLK